MKARTIRDGVLWMGAIDWERRLFDCLIPTPDGTSYNAYLIRGSEKTVLVDTVEPSKGELLLAQLDGVPRLDVLVCQHAEQDHSGLIPVVLDRYPEATLITSPMGKTMLASHLGVSAERVQTVKDGDVLSLGDRTLEFVHTPWVHWPETMSTYLREERILFSCDFFGSHLATSELYAGDDPLVVDTAKRYFAEIMMPFAKFIRKNLTRLEPLEIELIAPSHGPLWDAPEMILDAYRSWVSDSPANRVVLPHVSMHGSTGIMVRHLMASLVERGVRVEPFDLTVVDEGKLAMALVDAATLVVGTPTVNGGPHPRVAYAAHLVNLLKPRLKHAALIGSFGWSGKLDRGLAELLPDLELKLFEPVLSKGLPGAEELAALDVLAERIASAHGELGLV